MSALFRGITSKHEGDFYFLNCLYLFRTENKLKKHYNGCKNHDCYYVEMPKEDDKRLKHNYGDRSMKSPFIIYSDLELILKKMNTRHNNSEK